MATKQQSLTPLIDIQSAAFAEEYERGVWWSLSGEPQGKELVRASFLVITLQEYAERDYFNIDDPFHRHYLGFVLGRYHGGILSPHTSQRRPDVTTLSHLDHPDAQHGYHAGREFYFVDALPHEQRMSEQFLLERLRESVNEMFTYHDEENTWFFFVGCLLGELSGQLFPMTPTEQRMYLPQRHQREQAYKRLNAAQEQRLQSALLQKVETV